MKSVQSNLASLLKSRKTREPSESWAYWVYRAYLDALFHDFIVTCSFWVPPRHKNDVLEDFLGMWDVVVGGLLERNGATQEDQIALRNGLVDVVNAIPNEGKQSWAAFFGAFWAKGKGIVEELEAGPKAAMKELQ